MQELGSQLNILLSALSFLSHTHICDHDLPDEKVAGGFPLPTMLWILTPRGGGVTSDVSTRGRQSSIPYPYTLLSGSLIMGRFTCLYEYD